jgi:hypothetical protein
VEAFLGDDVLDVVGALLGEVDECVSEVVGLDGRPVLVADRNPCHWLVSYSIRARTPVVDSLTVALIPSSLYAADRPPSSRATAVTGPRFVRAAVTVLRRL